MKKLKDNRIIDLKNKTEYEKVIIIGDFSKKINAIFEELKDN